MTRLELALRNVHNCHKVSKLTEADIKLAMLYFYDTPHDARLTRIESTFTDEEVSFAALNAVLSTRAGIVSVPDKASRVGGWKRKRLTKAQGLAHYAALLAR